MASSIDSSKFDKDANNNNLDADDLVTQFGNAKTDIESLQTDIGNLQDGSGFDSSVTISDQVTISDTRDQAQVTPLTLKGARANPADNDNLVIPFVLNNDNDSAVTFARLQAIAEDVSNGSEDSSVHIDVIRGGTLEEVAVFNTSQIVLNESGGDRDFRVEASGEPNAFFVQGSDGNVGLGDSSPQARIEALGLGAATPTSDWFTTATFGFIVLDDQNQTAIAAAHASDTDTQRPLIYTRRSRGTLDSPSAVQDNDWLGSLIASGFDGTNFEQGASINFEVDGSVSTGAVPTAITFETGDDFNDRSERFRINPDGLISYSVGIDPEHATDGGTDAYDSATNTSTPGTGAVILRDFQSANTTTTPTLDGVTIKTRDGSALWAGAIDGPHKLEYDGTDYLLLDPKWDTAPFWRGHIDGCEISNGTDSDHDIDIAAGAVSMRDGSGNRKLFSVSAITKQIDANWAEGDDAGGFPSGLTLSTDTWYHVFLIGKDDGTVDAGFDTDADATNLLSDASSYPWFRHVGWILTDGSSDIIAFLQDGNDFTWDVPVTDEDNNNPGTSAVTLTVTAPPDEECQAIVNGGVRTSTGASQAAGYDFIISALAQTDTAPTASSRDSGSGRANNTGERELSVIRKAVRLNGSSQIRYRVSASDANMTFELNTIGWRDHRRGG